ncbi:MAG: hypothetical protein DRH37_05680 [Deltaproteobacteria bacterium]|nr:MAG: hypothetical protein DRH37_05680 [Deltaproteobacteria bacterium]
MPVQFKNLVFFAFFAVLISAIGLTAGDADAKDLRLSTITSKITAVNGMVITLDNGGIFYPAMEIEVPDWAVAGAEVSISYSREGKRNCYYEMVRPGETLTKRRELERLYRKKN